MAGEFNNMNDVDALLTAAYKPDANSKPTMVMPLSVEPARWPATGGAIGAVTPPAPVFSGDALLWVGAGIGTALLFSGGLGGVNGPKKSNYLVPVLIGGAALAYYFFGDKLNFGGGQAPAQAPASGGLTNAVSDINRVNLQNTYASQPKELSVVNTTSSDNLRKWALVVQAWTRGDDPYKLDTNGNPTSNTGTSLGSWWGTFKQQNGFA